jgi:4'-phosphopantetheinyl transferase
MRPVEAKESMDQKKGNIVQVLYSFSDRRLAEQAWETHFCKLPKETQTKIIRYRRWEDRQAGVFGKLLLMDAMKRYGYTTNALSSISLDAYGRPRTDYLVDFNISHSGEYVVCAVSEGERVGIDIENRKVFCFSELTDCFSAEEKEELMKSENRTARFYDFWTMKESVLKADGRGLSTPMDQIIIEDGRARLNGATWFLTELDFGSDYSCHLATNIEHPAIEIEKLEFH